MFKRKIAAASVLLAAGLSSGVFAQGASVTADFTAEKTPVSKDLFGIFYEDINYAADGGLYGEMIQNRSFEYQNARKQPTSAWDNVNIKGAKSASKIKASKKGKPLNENNPTYGTLKVKALGDGIANRGYDGIPFEAGKKYPGYVYLRSTDGTVTEITLQAQSRQSKKVLWESKITGLTKDFKKYEFTVSPNATAEDGIFSLYATAISPDSKGEASFDIDFCSVFRADIYRNEPNGFRKDLAQMLEDMHPAFIRFPGGCIVHGADLDNRYEWKNTIGPVEQRKEKMNFWGYEQSNGIGFFEYLRFCEDIGAEPIPVLSVGMAHNGQISSTADYENYAQDYLDFLEYATGPADSEWGSKRAEAGHPEPFKVNYIGVGNEDCGQDYLARFQYISTKIKAKYPNVKTIISSGFTYNDVNFHNAWNQVKAWEKNKKTKNLTDLVDEHYYNDYMWFLTNGQRYDDTKFYPRGEGQPKVFIGEYAAWVDGRRNSLLSALCEAAYMTSIERNGDIVEIASIAPLFARMGNTQWVPDAIWFNNTESYGSPNYYVQKMFMNAKSDQTVKTLVVQPENAVEKKFIGGTVGIGTWATTANFSNLKLTNTDTKETIFATDKTLENLDDFREETGAWGIKKGVINQTSQDINVRAMLNNEIEMEGVQNYDFELTATKVGGAEGFLIMFGVKGKNLYWWNLGGWGNTQSCVEKGTSEARTIVGDSKPINLIQGKPYKIKIEVRGETFRCYLDGQLYHEFTDAQSYDPIFVHVGETSDKVIVKIVNMVSSEQNIQINLNGAPSLTGSAIVTYLTGDMNDENSFFDKTLVSPKTRTLSGISSNFVYSAPKNSLSILEIQKK